MRVSFLFSLLALLPLQLNAVEVVGLRTEHLVNPLGVDNAHPRLSWQLMDEGSDVQQAACRVLVSSDSLAFDAHQVWDSGRIAADIVLVSYDGQPLEAFTRYWWKVRYEDGETVPVESTLQSFETGMMTESAWRGHWISDAKDRDFRPAPRFRKELTLRGKVVRARAYIAAAGLYTLEVNGRKAGDRILDPAFTRYDRRILYSTLDITPLLQAGGNALGVELGNGWYNHQPSTTWRFNKAPWRDRPAFCMDVRILYEDGSCETVSTDLSWKTSSDGPLVYNNLYTGEHYDARKLQRGWSEAGYDDSDWDKVIFRSCPAEKIVSQLMYPIRESAEEEAVEIVRLRPTRWVYDFGTNRAGNVHLHLKGEKGTVLQLLYAEKLGHDGRADLNQLDAYYFGDRKTEPFQTDIVTLSGEEDFFSPAYSYKGFRYVEVNASRPVEMSKENLTVVRVGSDVPEAGQISSSVPILEAIHQATRRAYLSNLMGFPTDCPQREKNGWTGDAHIAIETGLYNFDAFTVYEKWMADHRDEQQPNGVLPDIIPTGGWGYQPMTANGNGLDWTSTIALIPWNLYLFYGDSKPLRDGYDNLRRYVDYALSLTVDGLCTWGRGDWVAVTKRANKTLITSCFLYKDLNILVRAARLFGHTEDERKYAAIAAEVKAAVNARYLDTATGIYAEGMQTEQSLPLLFGLVPEELRGKVAAALEERVKADGYHINAGVHGAKAVLTALCDNGYADSAFRIATAEDAPSWGWWVRNGQSTLVENWNLDATRDNSLNHIMFGDISAWQYRCLGGIRPDPENPGFRHIVLQPVFPKGMKHFDCRYASPYGTISVHWERKGRKVLYSASLPGGTYASFVRPDGETEIFSGTRSFFVY